ncbi:MAG: 1-deoxy-D-xylulose-5-phosphate reductoisomerase [Bacteroidales bacterium]|jgi:1-deoxy-D-xylulose-5-phosphate reductoisomerase|nr:1-deoxy-D-xylulose-5-phosphate reductoisomerase [Bacteroidales bacterium]
MKKRIAILGSTGSIGSQTLDVISSNNDIFEVEVLTAQSNADLLIKQAIKYQPNAVVIADENYYNHVKQSLSPHDIKVYTGSVSLEQIVEMNTIDMVLIALVGFAGLKPALNALHHQKPIALANKEVLVGAGELIMKTAKENNTCIIPVDSEHSAIFQCLHGEFYNKIERITITASGGPFWGRKSEDLQTVTPKQALNHPNWSMGNKVTVDSSTMMNKGLEMIEAKWLFGLSPSQIEISVHPQSIIHSLVHFEDGSIKAQMSLPDMHLPIQYALSYPHRLKNSYKRFSFSDYPSLTFFPPDTNTFRCLSIAYHAIERGGNIPCCMSSANEIAVEAFLSGQLPFLQIAEIVEKTMQQIFFVEKPSIEDCLFTDEESRLIAKTLITKQKSKICQ